MRRLLFSTLLMGLAGCAAYVVPGPVVLAPGPPVVYVTPAPMIVWPYYYPYPYPYPHYRHWRH